MFAASLYDLVLAQNDGAGDLERILSSLNRRGISRHGRNNLVNNRLRLANNLRLVWNGLHQTSNKKMDLYEGLLDDDLKTKVVKKQNDGAPPTAVLLKKKRGVVVGGVSNVASTNVDEVTKNVLVDPDDPYDPLYPNDYAKVKQARVEQQEQEKKRAPNIGLDLLKKAGWDGRSSGLGKDGQGIMKPIESGKETEESLKGSKVVLLKNVVGAGDVDRDLEGDLAEECKKYGQVLKVEIVEAKEEDLEQLDAADHVHVYVHYAGLEQAKQAQSALDGRWFASRKVQALFAKR